VAKEIFSETVLQFMAPVRDYLEDPDVSEVMVNGHENIYIEKKGKLFKTERSFPSEESFLAAMRNIGQFTGRQISRETYQVDARLPDGSRVQILFQPCANRGPYLAIRKFMDDLLSLKDLIDSGSLNEDMYTFIHACVLARKNIIISGGTSSGKTTFLNLVSDFIPDGERIITIEDACELQIMKSHVLPMETRKADMHGKGAVTIRDLLVVSLRMRPDRIIVGECRSGEALDMLQAMNTGHSGSLTTLHANSGKDTLHRLETMALMSGVDLPLVAVRSQVASAISVVLQTARLHDGSRKLMEIVEVLDLDMEGNYRINPIYSFDIQGRDEETGAVLGAHRFTGNMPTFAKELNLLPIELPQDIVIT